VSIRLTCDNHSSRVSRGGSRSSNYRRVGGSAGWIAATTVSLLFPKISIALLKFVRSFGKIGQAHIHPIFSLKRLDLFAVAGESSSFIQKFLYLRV
jgi:hypothetical protein